MIFTLTLCLQNYLYMKLPQYFVDRTRPLMGDDWDKFVNSLQAETPTSIRLNMDKTKTTDLDAQVPWCTDAYYLDKRPQFTFDPLLHMGTYYVQEASSMFVKQAVKQLIAGDVRVLDLCAAPGGKSTLLSSSISENSLLVSNEIIRSRANILAENLTKWGNPNHIVSNNKPDDFASLKHFFDLILVDAPCSGEGMFRKDPQAIDEWSVANVELCAKRQKEILTSVWNALKPGGYLCYSTCTYNREENEEIVSWLSDEFDATIKSLEIDESWNIAVSQVKGADTYHFYPYRTKGEGFFLAVLQKSEEESIDTRIFKQKKDKKAKKSVSVSSEYKEYLVQKEDFTLLEEDGFIHAVLNLMVTDVEILKQHLKIISQGICMGQIKGRDFIPHQSLALSRSLNNQSFETYEVDWKTAITYLRSEVVVLPDSSKGYILLTYKGLPLGFVKNLGNRANNLYPNEWRIRSANIPDNEVQII